VEPFEITAQGVCTQAVVVDLRANSKEAALRETLGLLAESKLIGAEIVDDLHRSLMRREQLGSTGIGQGIAAPHCRHIQIRTPIVAVGRLPHRVDWDSLDGEPVRAVFLMLARPDRPGDSLRILEWVATTWMRKATDMLMQAGSPVEARQTLMAMQLKKRTDP
jgi:nitrogen PTS system EIIA component